MALESLPKIAPALFSAEQDLIQIYNKKSDTVGTINASLIGTPPSGVSGAIQFSTGSAFGSDSANLFWDDTNNRLGIGTTTPLGILHLKRTADTTRMVMDGDAGQSKIITYRTAGLQRFGLYVNNTAESGSNAGSDFAIRAYNDAGTLLSTPVFIKRSTGNVGINTTAPTNTLSVVGADNVNNLGVYGASGRLQIRGYLSATYGTLFESTTSGGTLMPTTISASKILLLDGQVGINTTSISSQLHIKGSGSTSATSSLFVQNSAGTAAMTIKDDRSTNLNGTLNINTVITGGSDLINVYSQGPGVMLFQITEDQNMYLNALNTILRSNGTWNSTGQYGTNFYASNWYPQGGERIGWNFGGNALAATGADSQISLIRINPAIGNFSVGTTNQGNALLITPTINQVNTGTHTIRGIYYNPTLTSLTGTTHRAIETVTGDVLLATTSGNVGIGTSSPTVSALNIEVPISGSAISDRINLYLSSSSTSAGIKLAASNGGSWIQSTQGANGNTPYNLNLNPFGSNVTIGTTTNLGASLGIKGSGSTSATTSLLVQNSSGTTAFQVKDNLQASVGNGFGGDGIRFEPGNNSAIIFTQGSDRVGLSRTNGDQLNISFSSGTNTLIGNAGICNDGSNVNYWRFESRVNTPVTLDTTGYVKVFINNVAYKLAVCV